jgi:hypothetical protein
MGGGHYRSPVGEIAMGGLRSLACGVFDDIAPKTPTVEGGDPVNRTVCEEPNWAPGAAIHASL